MAALTSLLARDEVVSIEMIEAALQRQVLEGGDLDTALLELGALPENTLSAYRAVSFGLRPASRDDVMQPAPEVLAKLTRSQIETYRLSPLSQLDDRLRVAAARPLTASEEQTLTAALGQPIEVRIAVAARVEAALAAFYGLSISSRLRRLAEQLDREPAGSIPAILPPRSEPTRPTTGGHRRASSVPPAGDALAGVMPQPVSSSGAVSIAPMVSITPGAQPVVVPASRPPPAPDTAKGDGGAPTPEGGRPQASSSDAPAPQSLRARPIHSPSRPRMRRLSAVPRGPLTNRQARDLLDGAVDRDAIIDIFFSYARQFFDCTVLLAVRSDVLLGMEAHGLTGGVGIDNISIPAVEGASVHDSIRSLLPRVVHLGRKGADKGIPAVLGRLDAQPAALIPVCIQQRAVAVLYGDRDGEVFSLDELGNLLGVMPSVVRAFERVIRGRKLLAVQAGRRARASLPPNAEPSPSYPPNEGPRPSVPAPGATRKPIPSSTPPPTSKGSQSAQPSDKPWTDGPSASGPEFDLARQPTIQLPSQEAEDLAKTPRSSYPAPGDRPGKSSRSSGPSRRPANHPTKPPPGTGQYRATSQAPPERLGPMSSPPASPEAPRSSTRPSQAPPAETGRARTERPTSFVPRPNQVTVPRGRGDERSDGSQVLPTDVVRVSASVSDASSALRAPAGVGTGSKGSLHPSALPQSALPQSALPPSALLPSALPEPSIIVDTGIDVSGMINELCQCGPDDEGPTVEALLSLGEPALPLLTERFPGPLWFDRHRPHRRMPVGSDVSAIARAFIAFGPRANPWLARLLTSKDSDVRFYAVLLASEAPDPSLLDPMFQAIFDPDGQVRLLARDALRAFTGMAGFDEALEQLRERATDTGLATTSRVDALSGLQAVRDPGSVPWLVALCGDPDRMISDAAHEALVCITGHDFGRSPRKWRAWLKSAGSEDRVQWLIDGLIDPSEAVRAVAGNELQKATQVYYGYVASASRKERERIRGRYQDWWRNRQTE